LKPSPTHARLAADLQREPSSGTGPSAAVLLGGGRAGSDPLADLTRAFALVESVQPLRDRLRQSNVRNWREAHQRGAVTDAQAAQLEAAEALVLKVLQVDDFAPEALSPQAARTADAAAGAHPEANPEARPEAKPEANPEANPRANPDPEPDA